MDDWNKLPQDRRDAIIALLVMESEGGGWIPNELFESNPEEAKAQSDAVTALAEHLGSK